MDNPDIQHSAPRECPLPQNIVVGQRVTLAKVQRAKELRRQMTEAETILWQHLRANRLNGLHFRRQQIIDGFIVDFYCHAAGLVIEVDGKIHERNTAYDIERDNILTTRGLYVLRVTNDEVKHSLDQVLTLILTVCNKQTSPPSPLPY